MLMKASNTSNTGAWDFPGGENVKEGSEERRIEAQRKKRVETNVVLFRKACTGLDHVPMEYSPSR